jgi:very-short-patch-repair endonuclease
MSIKNIVTGQRVTAAKVQRARELRQNMTPAERTLWQKLRANRLDGWHFRRQQIIDGFIVDFYCHQAGLVIEIDGPIHAMQREADTERETVLRGRGLTVLRFTNREFMNNMRAVLNTIRQTLRAVSPPRAGEGPGEGFNV